MSKWKYLMLVLGAFVLLFIMLGMNLMSASAQLPQGFTETPTEVTDTGTPTEIITETATPTETGTEPPPPPPGQETETPTPTVTETDDDDDEEDPTRTPRPPALPETGQAPPAPTGLDWRGLFAVLLFALIGTLIFRAVNRYRENQ